MGQPGYRYLWHPGDTGPVKLDEAPPTDTPAMDLLDKLKLVGKEFYESTAKFQADPDICKLNEIDADYYKRAQKATTYEEMKDIWAEMYQKVHASSPNDQKKISTSTMETSGSPMSMDYTTLKSLVHESILLNTPKPLVRIIPPTLDTKYESTQPTPSSMKFILHVL